MTTAVYPGSAWLSQLKPGMLGAPLLIVLILGMMILPLPPFALDLLFTFNIALSLIVLLASVYTVRPLDFAAFPIVLLLTTLLRLSLNVASTRVVLMHGHTGEDAAGKVIEAFGHFLVGGDFTVGLVVFAIFVVINFVVITKGAGRIAEVTARFSRSTRCLVSRWQSTPDLNAGLIGEEEARSRRREIQEAEFYGSMDGASKFVRGDAVAGILILFINVIGGLAVGVLRHDLSFEQAANNYILLAIGDGLVAQIPALVISTAAGLVVSRVGDGKDLGQQLLSQLQDAAGACPHGWRTSPVRADSRDAELRIPVVGKRIRSRGFDLSKTRPDERSVEVSAVQPVSEGAQEASWEDLVPVDVLGLEVGYRLIALVDKAQDGELLKRIKGIRKKFAQEIGFLPPAVHIRDNLELRPNGYRVTLKGAVIGEGETFNGMFLAINPGQATGSLPSTPTKIPPLGFLPPG